MWFDKDDIIGHVVWQPYWIKEERKKKKKTLKNNSWLAQSPYKDCTGYVFYEYHLVPTWLPHHVTYNIIIILKTFYMSSCSYGDNFVSIRQAVAEKNTHVVCGQTNRPKCNKYLLIW